MFYFSSPCPFLRIYSNSNSSGCCSEKKVIYFEPILQQGLKYRKKREIVQETAKLEEGANG
jgi:hypothetical protein